MQYMQRINFDTLCQKIPFIFAPIFFPSLFWTLCENVHNCSFYGIALGALFSCSVKNDPEQQQRYQRKYSCERKTVKKQIAFYSCSIYQSQVGIPNESDENFSFCFLAYAETFSSYIAMH